MRIILISLAVITLATPVYAYSIHTDHGWVNMGRDPNTIIIEPPPFSPTIKEQLREQQHQLDDLQYQIWRK